MLKKRAMQLNGPEKKPVPAALVASTPADVSGKSHLQGVSSGGGGGGKDASRESMSRGGGGSSHGSGTVSSMGRQDRGSGTGNSSSGVGTSGTINRDSRDTGRDRDRDWDKTAKGQGSERYNKDNRDARDNRDSRDRPPLPATGGQSMPPSTSHSQLNHRDSRDFNKDKDRESTAAPLSGTKRKSFDQPPIDSQSQPSKDLRTGTSDSTGDPSSRHAPSSGIATGQGVGDRKRDCDSSLSGPPPGGARSQGSQGGRPRSESRDRDRNKCPRADDTKTKDPGTASAPVVYGPEPPTKGTDGKVSPSKDRNKTDKDVAAGTPPREEHI